MVKGEARLRAAGLEPGRGPGRARTAAARTAEIETGEGEGGAGLAYIGALLLYVAIITFGYSIASSVVAEKSSRVVEVVLERDPPGPAARRQGARRRPARAAADRRRGGGRAGDRGAERRYHLPSSTAETVVLVLVYFVLGYLFYGCAFAGTASLVSRQEDIQSTTSPLLVIAIGSYIATNAPSATPSGSLATIGTFLPPMAPMVVPGRAAQGALPAWELAVSLLLMLAAIVVVVFLAGRIYNRSVLRFGTPLKLREAFKLVRS